MLFFGINGHDKFQQVGAVVGIKIFLIFFTELLGAYGIDLLGLYFR